jgi:glycosyltransferase involved in cell wall biosynthesis
MKIVIIGTAHPLRGGLAAYNERLAYAFQEAGDEVEIYSFSLQYPGFLFPGKTQYSSEPAPEGLKIQTKINSINPFNWLSVGNEISKLKPDIVIVKFWLPFMGPCFGTILRRIKRNKHSRIVSIIDNIIPHEKRVGDKPFAKYFVKAVDAFIVMSKSVEEDMKKFVGPNQPVRFIPHPIYDNYGLPVSQEESRKKLQLEPDAKYLLFFGFIRDYKGLDLLLEAMGDERIRKMGIKAIVAGEYYSDSKPYEEQIDRLGIRDLLVLHTDFIPNSEVAPFFGAADMVVQPYKTATQSGISQMAYHFEKPMLVTNVGGLPEIVPNGKAGYVTEVDAKAIADAIVDFYENNRVASFQNFVKEEKKKFAWETMVDGIKSLANENGLEK